MKIRKGVTKFVLVFKKFVIKFPNLFNGLECFYSGLSSNIEEKKWIEYSREYDNYIPYIYFISFLGFFSIQENCEEITKDTFKRLNIFEDEWTCDNKEIKYKKYSHSYHNFDDIDYKKENFGYSNKKQKIVLVDWIHG